MKRSGTLTRRTPLRRVSTRRARQLREYAARRAIFLAKNPLCVVAWHELDQGRKTTEIHHKKHREGERLNDERFWLAVSRAGHRWIHSHPREARQKGYLL